MSALASQLECLDCQRLTSKIAEVQAQIIEARAQLEEAIEAADGTSARKFDALEGLLKTKLSLASEIQVHDRVEHNGYVPCAD